MSCTVALMRSPGGGGEEELRIGSFAGDADYQFGQVGTVAVSSLGEIFVSDTQYHDGLCFHVRGSEQWSDGD